jgi:hypothetical protein
LSTSHVVYGLKVAVNQPLPGLFVQSEATALDLGIRLKEEGPISTALNRAAKSFTIDSRRNDESQANLRTSTLPESEHVGLFYRDGARFAIECHGREVWADWPENYTLEDACTYLLGPVMGFVLRLRGTVCLHASAVAVDNRAIALVGQPGAGKSTTAAAFACCGFTVLSDDVVALADKETQFLVEPGYPRVNLWPDSVRQLFGSDDALPRITPTWEKRYLPLGQDGYQFASSPLPLGGIYILDGRDETLTAPIIKEISGEQAFILLVANTYVNYLLDQDMRRTEFDVLSRVVSGIPVRRVRAPEEPSAIFGFCEAIADDARRVMAAIPANAASVLG